MKHVHDYLQVIEYDPLTRWKTIDRRRAYPMVLAQPLLDFARNGSQMRLRRSRTNHEKIRERRDPAEIENCDILSLFVVRQFGATTR